MNSVLGTIQLGTWQLGAVQSVAVTTGSFVCSANPTAKVTGLGGVPRTFTSVLGTVRLGLWQLGQVPAGSVTEHETVGKGSFLARAFPDVGILPIRLTGAFTCTIFPAVKANGNRGPLLLIFSGFPDCTVASIAYYADGSFSCSAFPDVTLVGIRPGAALCTAYPDVVLSPLIGQAIDCLSGPSIPVAEPTPNFAY